ncbi:MAG TPA: ABC transporter permease [Elusimicrobiota bacterium]|jgi:peptide/nickel transport system permease protein|nr:ABC transporter permease [Elusimicrobiota bacterium]
MREAAAEVWKRLRAKPLSLAGLGLVAFFAALAALAPILAPAPASSRDPYLIPQDGYSPDPVRPSRRHLFGTTEQQYDLYYGIVWGARTAFKVGCTVAAVSLAVGVAMGGLAGFYGGWVDEVLMRATDVIMALPGIILAVVIVTVRGPGLFNVMLAIALVHWPSYARLVRADVLSVRQRDFVLAARSLGAGDARILARHVLPNSIYPVLVVASLDIGAVVITAAALSFLGLGAPPGYADWGQLISLSRNWILGSSGSPLAYWHTVAIPGLTIFLFTLGWNLLGDAFRDILDPRQK